MSSDHGQVMSPGSVASREFRESEESGPQVGLFYVVDGKLYWEGVSTAHASTSAYFKTYPKKHSVYWKGRLLRILPGLKDYDWCQFPRGRVVFSTQEGIYRLMADKCILENSGLIKKIVSEMRLLESKIKMSWDIDCECVACKSDRTRIKDDEDEEIEAEFKTADDGHKVFFPWKGYFPWVRHHGYIVSLPEYERIRKWESRWLKIRALLATANAALILEFALVQTGSRWMSFAMVFLGSYIPFALSHLLWLRHQCRGLKRVDARGFELNYADRRERGQTGTRWASGVVLLPLLMVIAVWLMLGIPQDIVTVRIRPSQAAKATASTTYTGQGLPHEVCTAISDFTRKVDTAVTQLWEQPAELAVQGAWVELDETLNEFSDHPNINEVRQIAAEYGSTRLRVKELENRSELPSDKVRKGQAKIKEFSALFHAMCGP